jgi:hypothetical protein
MENENGKQKLFFLLGKTFTVSANMPFYAINAHCHFLYKCFINGP